MNALKAKAHILNSKEWIIGYAVEINSTTMKGWVMYPIDSTTSYTAVPIPIDINTICYWTGEYDKYEHEIYSNDLIQFTRQQGYHGPSRGSRWCVQWFDYSFLGLGVSRQWPLTKKKCSECMVYGNRFDGTFHDIYLEDCNSLGLNAGVIETSNK